MNKQFCTEKVNAVYNRRLNEFWLFLCTIARNQKKGFGY